METIDVVLMDQHGWWTAFCEKLGISGFGTSEDAALEAFKRSLISNQLAAPSLGELSQHGTAELSLRHANSHSVSRQTISLV
jgi:hypothetical protein